MMQVQESVVQLFDSTPGRCHLHHPVAATTFRPTFDKLRMSGWIGELRMGGWMDELRTVGWVVKPATSAFIMGRRMAGLVM